MAKKNEMVYVVVRPGRDTQPDFVSIRGVFRTREDAQAWRQELWDEGERPQCEVRTFFLMPIK